MPDHRVLQAPHLHGLPICTVVGGGAYYSAGDCQYSCTASPSSPESIHTKAYAAFRGLLHVLLQLVQQL